MKKIGIVPQADLLKTDSIYDDKYHFVNSYIERVVQAGALPVGVLPLDGRIQTEILDGCDALLIQGGRGIYGYHMDVMEHAVKTGKKVLGICLGMQSIHTYFAVREEAERIGWKESIADLYVKRREEGKTYIEYVPDHRAPSMPRHIIETTKHKVLLEKGTHIYDILGQEEIMGASMHTFCVKEPTKYEVVSGRAEDGTIEAIEIGDRIIGTQFHPDVDGKLMELFRWLAEA